MNERNPCVSSRHFANSMRTPDFYYSLEQIAKNVFSNPHPTYSFFKTYKELQRTEI